MSGQTVDSESTQGAHIVNSGPLGGILWGGFAVATVFTACRFCLRYRAFRRFFVDDALAALAWLLTLAACLLGHIYMLEVYRALSASPETMSPELLAKLEVAPKANSAHLVLTYAAIWAVKISFLDFFRRIYRNLMTWMRYWWIVFWITAAGCVGTLTAWTVILTTINYRCLGDGAAPEEMACPDNYGDEVWKRIAVAYISSCTLDISTDIIITCIPVTMLWKIRISRRRKAALGLLLSLTIITMAFSITRLVTFLGNPSLESAPAWMLNWANLEVYTALVVSALGSFRGLFVSQDSKPAIVRSTDEQRYNPRNSPRRKLSAFVDSLLSTLVDSEGDDDGKSTRKKDCLESTASTWGVSANRELDNIVKG